MDTTRRNRRYRHAEEVLLRTTNYFSEAEMHRRHPGLVEEYLGHLMESSSVWPASSFTDEDSAQREASGMLSKGPRPLGFAAASRSPDSRTAPPTVLPNRVGFVNSMLCDLGEEALSDADVGDGLGGGGGETGGGAPVFPTHQMRPIRCDADPEEVEDARKALVRACMEKFLCGADTSFISYETIDANGALDVGHAEMERDEEESYFDY